MRLDTSFIATRLRIVACSCVIAACAPGAWAAGSGASVSKAAGGFAWFTTNGQLDAVFASIDGALWYSTGGTLTNISAGIGGTSVSTFQAPSRDFVWAGTDRGVWVSFDRGTTWQARNAGLSCLNINHAVVSNTGTMYASGTCNQIDSVFRSFDRGIAWQALPALPGSPKINRMNRAADTASSRVLVYTTSGSYHMLDTTSAWFLRENPTTTIPPRNIPPTSDIIEEFQTTKAVCIALVRNVGPYRTENCPIGVSSLPAETLQTKGLPTLTAFGKRLGQVNSEVLVPILGDGVYRFDSASASWVRAYTDAQVPGLYYVRDITAGSPTLLASSTTSGMWRSDDSGTTWQPFGLPVSSTPSTPPPADPGAPTLAPVTPPPQTSFAAPAGKLPEAAVASVEASSDIRSLTVAVVLDLSKILAGTLAQSFAAGSGYNVYVVALVPGERLGGAAGTKQVFQQDAEGTWGLLTSPIAAFLQGAAIGSADSRVRVEILRNMDLSALRGTEFYVGYGTSDGEMMTSGRYRGVYIVN